MRLPKRTPLCRINQRIVREKRVATFVVAHGAWSAGWAWKKMHPLMAAAGHRLVTPTHTGLGERGHLAHPDITLETHITDIRSVLEFEDLRDVIVVGHSYGGMVATGVADQTRERVAKLVYLDAFAPRDGESSFSLQPPEHRDRMRERARTEGDGWCIPPNPLPPDTPESDKAWADARRLPQPIKTFETPLKLRHGEPTLPRHYIYCKRNGPGDVFRPSYERAQREGWQHYEIDASHNPHITAPDVLAGLFNRIAT
jgi:pimeloyl-ACP methyl ester carboxylesterase